MNDILLYLVLSKYTYVSRFQSVNCIKREGSKVQKGLLLYVYDSLAAEGDVDGGLLLVPGEDPHHDPRLAEPCDGVRHSLLQPVLDTRGADHPHPVLQGVEAVHQQLVALLQAVAGLELHLCPVKRRILVENSFTIYF